MSLDIGLIVKGEEKKKYTSGIFIRENGQTKEISDDEWEKRFPGRTPTRVNMPNLTTDQVFGANITHNMGQMAEKAGLYYAMWRPEEKGWKYAKDIILPLESGILILKKDPTFFKNFNPDNGWGSYEILLEVAESYLAACKKWPEAEIYVSR